ncbi:MAG: M24 family metallopeptidase [Terriglobales bacterium]
MDLQAIQAALRAERVDGWLFYDHHQRDAIGYRILGLPAMLASRRWYYLIPVEGEPRKLVHRIEAGALEALPGECERYARWGELEAGLRHLLALLPANPKVAMQYSPGCMLPAVSLADGGTCEQIRALGVQLVSAADLIARFDAGWTAEMLAGHRAAGKVIDAAIQAAFAEVRQALDRGRPMDEYGLQQWMEQRMVGAGLAAGEPPIVAVNAHAGDPHYLAAATGSARIQAGDLLLLDVWGRTDQAGSAYYDVTWMGYCLRPGENKVPVEFTRTFAIAAAARDAGVRRVQEAMAGGHWLRGFEVDQEVRAVIEAAGLGEYFVHRTGHSLGREVHASGANMDDYETHDVRGILPDTAFTIEPGIYCPQGQPFGVRTEVNLYVNADHAVEVTGPIQREIVKI